MGNCFLLSLLLNPQKTKQFVLGRSRLYSPPISIRYSSGVPGSYDVLENDNSNFSQSLKRIKAGINKRQVTPPRPWRTASRRSQVTVNFLGPKGRIELGCIAYKMQIWNERIFQTRYSNTPIKKIWPLVKRTLTYRSILLFFFLTCWHNKFNFSIAIWSICPL